MSRTASALLVITVLALASPAAAQTAYLVKDITPGSRFPVGSTPASLWSFQGKVFFSASEPSTGRELWITDGNGSGTRLLAEFCPGTCSSSPIPLGTAHSLLFGIAFPNTSDFPFDPQTGYLWRSDGTREGTFLLPDPLNQVALPFASDFFDPVDGPQVPIVFGPDVAYFAACNNSREKCGVWRTDGSAAGTVKLHEFSGSLAASDLTLVGSRLFFASYQQLWTSDGTAEGTVPVKDFPSATPRHLAALGTKVLFLAPAASPATGEELWVTDGTAAGTQALTSFETAQPFRQTHFLKTLGNKVYFVADDVTHGAEIWASDGTATGTVRVTDFGFHNPFGWEEGFSDGGLFSWQIEKLGDRLIFSATDGISDFQPWSNLGSPASTSPLCSTCTSETGLRFQPLNGKLVFVSDAGFNFSSLWATDGTPQGTRLLTQECSDCASELGAVPGAVFFPGPRLGSLRSTLWTSDGTPQGTRLYATVDPLSYHSPVAVALLGGKVLFSGWTDNPEDSDQRDEELWASDGTPDGTRLVADINRSGNPSQISQLVATGDRLFFTASQDNGDSSYVWSSQGTAASTLKSFSPFFSDFGVTSRLAVGGGKVFLIRALYSEGEQLWGVGTDGQTQPLTSFPENYTIRDPVSYQGKLYFGVIHGAHVPGELWQSDGTVLGTHKALDLPAEVEDLRWLRVMGSELWFLAAHDFNESSIWHTNGTTAGTHKVLDGFRHPDVDPEFSQLGTQVFFIIDNPGGADFDYQVWKSDGTPGGTSALTSFPDLYPSPGLPAGLTVFQGSLYFFGNLPEGNRALWRSDGTPGGTVVVRQFPRQPSPGFSLDTPLLPIAVLGSRLVFAVDDGVHGREPWSSDGTAGGTALLRDVRPGLGGSGVTGFTAAAGQLYFAADDGGHGSEIWRTDGTPTGTRLVQDLNPEGASSYPTSFTVVGNLLYFSADDGITGNELWALPLSGPACQAGPTALCLNHGRFRVEAHWKVPNGGEGSGQAVPLSTDTGYFWFFDPANVEAILKVLDATTLNDHFWVFYGALSNVEYSLTVTDTQTGLARRYLNPPGQFASVGDINGFGLLGAHDRKSLAAPAVPLLVSDRIEPAAATGTCVPGASRLCLSNGRFAVEAAWKDFTGRTGTGTAVGLTGDTGYFWFFDPANVEAVLKVLDATTFNGHFWVFYGALSNVEYTLTVTDTATSRIKTYKNPLGRFASAGDVMAF